MKKTRTTKALARMAALLACCLFPLKGMAQSGEEAVASLVKMGFENVAYTEDEKERVFVLQNAAYKLHGVGIGRAIDLIQQEGMPVGKQCRVIVLDNDVPQLSLTYSPVADDSLPVAKRSDWTVSYELEDSWKKVRKVKKQNQSQFKIDVLVYPKLYYKNLIITQIYQVLLEMSPAVEVSLWKGSKLTAQVILPVYNDGYPGEQENIRWGYLTLEQNFRLPYNLFLKARAGIFNRRVGGVELRAFRPFKDQRFSVEAKAGFFKYAYFYDMSTFRYDDAENYFTWSVGGNFFWRRYNTRFTLRAEQYLQKDRGVRAEMVRYFKYGAVGFYAAKAGGASANGGFTIDLTLPPYKVKRPKGYWPRVNTGFGTNTSYNAGNERNYYLMPRTSADYNVLKEGEFNPIYIKSQLDN